MNKLKKVHFFAHNSFKLYMILKKKFYFKAYKDCHLEKMVRPSPYMFPFACYVIDISATS